MVAKVPFLAPPVFGWGFFAPCRSGVAFPITMDLRYNRVNVWVDKAIVVSADIG
jgi:hypothetical protein